MFDSGPFATIILAQAVKACENGVLCEVNDRIQTLRNSALKLCDMRLGE